MSAAFACRLDEFDSSTAFEKLGTLIVAASSWGFATHFSKQTEAWQQELTIIEQAAATLMANCSQSSNWRLFFEFQIPRRSKRPDVVVVADDLVFVVEFKVGATSFDSGDLWQALSYALDIRDFHLASQGRRVIPILVATAAAPAAIDSRPTSPILGVARCAGRHGSELAAAIEQLYEEHHDSSASAIDPDEWVRSPYRPAPTIIEAAERLFAGHSVADISHSFAQNLDVTSCALVDAIRRAQAERQRTICFVTGTPGAGKTLTGLNAVHDPAMRGQGRPAAVFLSGNGPLVKIVREAIVRDRQRAGALKNEANRVVSTFIDNVHRFIGTYGLKRINESPYENAIVFDEAQRAWNAAAVARKHHVQKSEAELVLEIMERAPGWSVVIALVGGGQEIHRGEAGLEEWGNAIGNRGVPWNVLASKEALEGGASVAGHRLFDRNPPKHIRVIEAEKLHLSESVRSPRARRLGDWVNALLVNGSADGAFSTDTSAEFPIVLTRELETARAWLREHSEGVQRCGLVASSGALRLRAEGIEVSSGFHSGYSYEDWFLSGVKDTRSSMWLEVAATEFECQGLELDWTGVCWGGDFVRCAQREQWNFRRFRGTKWQAIRQPQEQRYVANKYRVLLTRARRGMVIWIPCGNATDLTRDPALFDATAHYLESQGIRVI
ncbi:MAG: DUF2075 domain-containing protein [Planctomycetes bacterium]|nr:DUF2075 domain-containing protein [Planctomycetota bacterium]